MPDNPAEPKGFLGGSLEEAKVELRKKIGSSWAGWIMAALTAIFGGAAALFRDLPERVRWLLWGGTIPLGVITLLLFGAGFRQYWRRRRAASNKAPSWLLWPLLNEDLSNCVSLALGFPTQDFLGGANPAGFADLIARLIAQYPFETLKTSYATMRTALKDRDTDEQERANAAMAVVADYRALGQWVLWSGRLFYGDAVMLSDSRYSQWHQTQNRLAAALQQEAQREVTRQLAENILEGLPNLPLPKAVEAAVSAEGVENFRALYKEYWERTFTFASEYLAIDLAPNPESLIGFLVHAFALPHLTKNKSVLDKELDKGGPPHSYSREEFTDSLLFPFRTTLLDYLVLVRIIRWRGEQAVGLINFYCSEFYHTLYNRHTKAIEKLREARHMIEIRWLADLLPMLEAALPPPQEEDAKGTLNCPSPPPAVPPETPASE